jgi:hypothetical protein
MADLIDTVSSEFPTPAPLRLSVFHYLIHDRYDSNELYANLHIGLFIGDKPLFNGADIIGENEGHRRDIRDGFFFTEDDDCYLLRHIYHALTTSEQCVFEDCEPDIRIVIAPDIGNPKYRPKPCEHFEVLTILQHGGRWHGQMIGNSGPAMLISVTRKALETFFFDLWDDATAACGDNQNLKEELNNLFPNASRDTKEITLKHP